MSCADSTVKTGSISGQSFICFPMEIAAHLELERHASMEGIKLCDAAVLGWERFSNF